MIKESLVIAASSLNRFLEEENFFDVAFDASSSGKVDIPSVGVEESVLDEHIILFKYVSSYLSFVAVEGMLFGVSF